MRNIDLFNEYAAVILAQPCESFPVKTPFELEQVTDAFVKLRSDGMDPTQGLLRTLGDATAAAGKPLTRAVEAMTGAVSGDNRGLADFGIEARAVEGGKIRYEYEVGGETKIAEAMAADGAQIRQVLGGILDIKFGGAMAEESKTFTGMLGNLTDQWARFQNLVMASGLFDFLKGRLGALLDTLDRMAADGSLQRIAEQVGTRAVAAFRAAEEAIEQPACLSHHAARRSVREGRQDEARAAWRAQAYLTVRRARQASATKSWRSYRVLRPSGDEKVRLGPWVERIGEALSWAAGKLGGWLLSEQRGMEAGALLEWRRMAMV
ncbi:MAG: hypothetical protein OXL36_19775 [Bryobacterales bacterium]|nr:hypothetical protein [Bryobacterales bacterium]